MRCAAKHLLEDPDPMFELAEILGHGRQVAEVTRDLAWVGACRLDHVEAHDAGEPFVVITGDGNFLPQPQDQLPTLYGASG